jgi:hypothetical protein
MKKEIKIIKLYCQICQYYDNILVAEMQRLSNNFSPKFSDEECITVHLWGIANEKYDTKAVHEFIVDYWGEWFPDLPGYESYVKRVNHLAPAFKALVQILVSEQDMDVTVIDHIMDSLPIMVANGRRSGSAKVASDICDKGYCASKDTYYYGVKLHSLNQKQYHSLPKPTMFGVTPASVSDITFAKEALYDVHDIDIYGDKIYNDSDWFEYMREHNNVNISAPVKLKKGQEVLESIDRLYNSAVSSIRQPIESFFSWLIEKTHIQSASKVRSSNGLLSFIFARLASIFLF